jgi:hypothetical protein
MTLTTSLKTSTWIVTVVLAKHEIAPWWWFLREPKHVGATVGILIVLIFLWFYICVHQVGRIKSALSHQLVCSDVSESIKIYVFKKLMCKNGKYLEQNGGNYSLNSSGLHLIMPYMLIIIARSLPKFPEARGSGAHSVQSGWPVTQDKFNSRLRCLLNSQCAVIYYCWIQFCFTLSVPQCIHRSLFLPVISFLLHNLRTAVYTHVSLLVISFLLHTLRTAVCTQVSLSCYGLLSISKTSLLLLFRGVKYLQ